MKTLNFLIELKSANPFWYQLLIDCAKINPKIARKCLAELFKHLYKHTVSLYDLNDINIFELCTLANQDALGSHHYTDGIASSSWTTHRDNIINRMLMEGLLGRAP